MPAKQKICFQCLWLLSVFGCEEHPDKNHIFFQVDLTQPNAVGRIPWQSAGYMGNNSLILDGPGRVIVKLSDNETFDDYVEMIGFASAPGMLTEFNASFPSTNKEDTALLLARLCKTWNLDTSKIKEWPDAAKNYPNTVPFLICRGPEHASIALEVFSMFDSDRPFRVSFTYGWGMSSFPKK